jgi:cysteine desulfuration protein SufE
MNKTVAEIEDEIVESFELFDDQMDKYEHIIDLGKKLPPLDEQFKTDEFMVKGCQSKVWLRATKQGDRIVFEADSNTAITKGIVALLVSVYTNQTAETILNSPLTFIDRIDLRTHLSSQRSNGLTAMLQKMKAYAAMLA